MFKNTNGIETEMDKLNQENNQSPGKGGGNKKKNNILFTLKKLMKNPIKFNIIFGNQKMDRFPCAVKKVLNQVLIINQVLEFMKGIKSLELSSKTNCFTIMAQVELADIFMELFLI